MVSVQGRQLVTEKLATVGVVSQPLVILTPASKTVTIGGAINVTCQLLTPLADFKNFIWYRNGNEMELKQGILIYFLTNCLFNIHITS